MLVKNLRDLKAPQPSDVICRESYSAVLSFSSWASPF